MQNLLPEPPAILLPADDAAVTALAQAPPTPTGLAGVAAAFPAYSAAWGALASRALRAGETVAAYAYARVGYHRGLDQLRRAGWKGHGPVPWAHEPNQGFLRCLYVLGRAAAAIGEVDEAARCSQFLHECDPLAVGALADLS